MDKKRKAYMLTIDDYLVICEMAMKNGKKAGDNMQAEFDEYVKTHPQVSCLGEYEDKDLLKGDMREKGYHKILDLTFPKDGDKI